MSAGVALNSVTSVVSYHEQPTVAATQETSPAATIPAARTDSRPTDNATPGIARDVIIDPHTNAVVFRVVDANTGHVIEQMPDQAFLRRRAYAHAQMVQALIERKDPDAAVLAAMQKVDATT